MSKVTGLPDAVRRYLAFMRVREPARDDSFRMRGTGRFRLSPKDPWSRCQVSQVNTTTPIARSFHMSVGLCGPIPVAADDTYAHGHGRMRVRILGIVPVVDATGDELDVGELVTWLADAVLFAPSMLLRVPVTWASVDDRSFDVTLTDGGRTVRGHVSIDHRGAPLEFSTTDRFVRDPFARNAPWRRTRWSTPVDGWTVNGGHPRPTAARAIWHLPEGDFVYAEMDLASAIFEHPSEAGAEKGAMP